MKKLLLLLLLGLTACANTEPVEYVKPLEENTNYVLTNLHAIDQYPPDEPGPHTNWSLSIGSYINISAFALRSTDGLDIKKVDKETKDVIEEYRASHIDFFRCHKEEAWTVSIISNGTVKDKYTYDEFISNDFYLVYNCVEGHITNGNSNSIGYNEKYDRPIYSIDAFYLMSELYK